MGMYDSFFYDNKKELQLKNGDCCCHQFLIGDNVSDFGYKDGIYFDDSGDKGYVVISNGVFIAGFDNDSLIDKHKNKLQVINNSILDELLIKYKSKQTESHKQYSRCIGIENKSVNQKQLFADVKARMDEIQLFYFDLLLLNQIKK